MKKRLLKILLPAVFLPLTVVLGAVLLREKYYAFAILAVLLLTVLFFYSGFERKKVTSRRLVVVAVMTALAALGRVILTPFPGVTPITAFAALTALSLGGEAGFMVGSLAALLSDFYAGQGVWTPFQMFAWGLTGLFAGLLAKQLKNNRVLLVIYGVIAGVAYSFLMDLWSVLWLNGTFSLKLYAAALVTSLPFTIIYAVTNTVLLLLLVKPFCKKLDRIKLKYGL
ncbi:MAG: ECF transporter S component [Clostridia bacterium]|nr:ECF transporter S component [Clostridia bacterium]